MKDILHSVPTIEEDDIEAVVSLLRSKHLEDGEFVRKLEQKLSEKTGYRYAVSTANGFGAIHLALIALQAGEGDEVIIPSYTCSALLNPIKIVGANPVIADISANGFNVDLQIVKSLITSRTKAIIIPHTFGYPVKDIDKIMALGIPVIEDCAQAIGGSYLNKPLGSFGTISIFSFYASKMLCGGDGGMLLTNDENIYKVARGHRSYGGEKNKREVAFNYRLTNMPAALALSQLEKLDYFIRERKKIAGKYDQLLNTGKINIHFEGKADSCFFRYPVEVNNRDDIKNRLRSEGIHCGYGVLENMHTLEGLEPRLYPNAEIRQQRVLSLPVYPTLQDPEIEFICQKLNAVIN